MRGIEFPSGKREGPPGWLVMLVLAVGIAFYAAAGCVAARGASVDTNRYHVPLWADPYLGATSYVWQVGGSNALMSATNSVTLSNLTAQPQTITVFALLTNGWQTSNSTPAPMKVLTLVNSTNVNGPYTRTTNTVIVDPAQPTLFLRLSNYDAITDLKKD